MARKYIKENVAGALNTRRQNLRAFCWALFIAVFVVFSTGLGGDVAPIVALLLAGILPSAAIAFVMSELGSHQWIEKQRIEESKRRNGAPVLGLPPDRTAFVQAFEDCRSRGKVMIDKYLVGFEVDSGKPIWVTDDEMCSHAAVFAKTGVGKTLWLEGLMFQQMARGRASGFTFIDAKRDPGTLADIIIMAMLTGRIEDLLVVDPFDPVCSYNFVFTTQRPDVKARKVLRCGLPPTSDQSTTKHYDRLAADAVYRVVRCMESLGLAWSVRDIAVALSAFTVAYPRLRALLHEQGAKQAMVELGHLASSYRTIKGALDSARLTDNLRGIASELHSISNSEAGEMFCVPRADLSLTDAILRGKLIYYMLPRLEEAESAARMVKVFREDLEVSIGEVTSSRSRRLEDPHMVIIDEGASTFGPTWANLFELARKGRFALLFGAQSVGGLMDETMGLSEQFYERVIANVNLKVIMRIGDNKTAEDMCEWIGKVSKTSKTIATGLSSASTSREFIKKIELNKRIAEGFREGLTVSEDEEDLVSAEELKHEMSAEKGLAWFDKGDGRLRKGRSIWFDSKLPATWEGREHLVKYETVEADEIGLAEWVDDAILLTERAESERSGAPGSPGPAPSGTPINQNFNAPQAVQQTEPPPAEEGPFRLNLLKGIRGKQRATAVVSTPAAPAPSVQTAGAPVQTAGGTAGNITVSAPLSTPPQSSSQTGAIEPAPSQTVAGRTVASAPQSARPAATTSATPPNTGNPIQNGKASGSIGQAPGAETNTAKPAPKPREALSFAGDKSKANGAVPTAPASNVSEAKTPESGPPAKSRLVLQGTKKDTITDGKKLRLQ
jgi:hypothetical protein